MLHVYSSNARRIGFHAARGAVRRQRLLSVTANVAAAARAPRPAPRTLHACHAAAVDLEKPSEGEALVTSKRKYVMVSGKGGVGKTSLSAALAVKYAAEGHDTLIVSTDPAHSLGDSLGQALPGGVPVPIEGTDLPIWGMEIDPDKVTDEFKAFAKTGGKQKAQVRLLQPSRPPGDACRGLRSDGRFRMCRPVARLMACGCTHGVDAHCPAGPAGQGGHGRPHGLPR